MSASPLVLSVRLPKTNKHSLTPATVSPTSLGFHPTVPHPCSLVKGVFWALGPWIALSTHTSTSEPCGTSPTIVGFYPSVRIGELGLASGDWFKCVIMLWMGLFRFVSLWERVRTPFSVLQNVPDMLSLFLGPFTTLEKLLLQMFFPPASLFRSHTMLET